MALLSLFPDFVTLSDYYATLTKLIIGHKPKLQFTFHHIAVITPLDSVRVVVGHSFALLATVEAEDVVSFATHDFLAPAHGFAVLCGWIFLLVHLYHGTATIPSIWREIGFPERVVICNFVLLC